METKAEFLKRAEAWLAATEGTDQYVRVRDWVSIEREAWGL